MQESKVCKSTWSLPGLNPISLNQQFALFPARHLNNTNKLTTRKSFHFQQYLSSHKICVINYAYPDSMQRSQYHIFIFFYHLYIFKSLPSDGAFSRSISNGFSFDFLAESEACWLFFLFSGRL